MKDYEICPVCGLIYLLGWSEECPGCEVGKENE